LAGIIPQAVFSHRARRRSPWTTAWEEIDILEIGELWDALDGAIEARCKVEDAERRRAAAAQHAEAKPRLKKHH